MAIYSDVEVLKVADDGKFTKSAEFFSKYS